MGEPSAWRITVVSSTCASRVQKYPFGSARSFTGGSWCGSPTRIKVLHILRRWRSSQYCNIDDSSTMIVSAKDRFPSLTDSTV